MAQLSELGWPAQGSCPPLQKPGQAVCLTDFSHPKDRGSFPQEDTFSGNLVSQVTILEKVETPTPRTPFNLEPFFCHECHP